MNERTTLSRRRLLMLGAVAAASLAMPYVTAAPAARPDAFVVHPDGQAFGRFDDHWLPIEAA